MKKVNESFNLPIVRHMQYRMLDDPYGVCFELHANPQDLGNNNEFHLVS